MTNNRILNVTANVLNRTPPKGFEWDRPQPYIKGKFFYIWIDDQDATYVGGFNEAIDQIHQNFKGQSEGE